MFNVEETLSIEHLLSELSSRWRGLSSPISDWGPLLLLRVK